MRLLTALLLLTGEGLSLEEFQRLHRELRPRKDEAWRSIPWKTSMVEARDRAVKEKKPLFLWSMNGRPLGCG